MQKLQREELDRRGTVTAIRRSTEVRMQHGQRFYLNPTYRFFDLSSGGTGLNLTGADGRSLRPVVNPRRRGPATTAHRIGSSGRHSIKLIASTPWMKRSWRCRPQASDHPALRRQRRSGDAEVSF
jgi:hypothetical protein